MKNAFIDLYSVVHEFYRTRNRGAERALAEGVCIATCMCAFMNALNIFEFFSDVRIPLPLADRMRIIVFGLAFYALGTLCIKSLIKRNTILQSPEQMRARSDQLSLARKVALFSLPVGNLIVLIMLAQYLRS